MASLMRAGLLSRPAGSPLGLNLKANFVAMITLWRGLPLSARPSSSSFLKGPYTSAVSQKLMPRSSAR